MSRQVIIEKLNEARKEIEEAFDTGRIDLDGISSILAAAANHLETQREHPGEMTVSPGKSPSLEGGCKSRGRKIILAQDYR